MYRIKNEARWIKQSIESIYDFCDEIVILDDNSTDDTMNICTKFDKVVDIHTKTDSLFDEALDRNFLLDMALKRKPDVLLSLDGDEIFLPGSGKIIQEEIDILYPDKQVFEFQLLTLWDNPNHGRPNWSIRISIKSPNPPHRLYPQSAVVSKGSPISLI